MGTIKFLKIDHLPIFATLKSIPPTLRQTKQIWDYKHMDPDKLTTLLLEIDWNRLLDLDLDEATDNFTDVLMTAAKAAIPVLTISPPNNNKPWFSAELKGNSSP